MDRDAMLVLLGALAAVSVMLLLTVLYWRYRPAPAQQASAPEKPAAPLPAPPYRVEIIYYNRSDVVRIDRVRAHELGDGVVKLYSAGAVTYVPLEAVVKIKIAAMPRDWRDYSNNDVD